MMATAFMILLPGFGNIYHLLFGKNNCLLIGRHCRSKSRKANKKQQIEQEEEVFHRLFLFNNSPRISHDCCTIRNIFYDNRTSTDGTPFSNFYSLDNTSANSYMTTLSYFYIAS